jgi:hypothetical protein
MFQPLWVVISPIKTMYQNHPDAHWRCRLVPEESHHHRRTKEKPRGGKQPTLCLILPLPHLGNKLRSSWVGAPVFWGALDLGDWCCSEFFDRPAPPRNSMQWLCKKSRTVFGELEIVRIKHARCKSTNPVRNSSTARKKVVSAFRFPLKILSS